MPAERHAWRAGCIHEAATGITNNSDFHMQKEMRRAAAKRVGENTVFSRGDWGDYEFMPLFCITQD